MLKGSQHKIDMNKNGKIDAGDFAMLRNKKHKGKKHKKAEVKTEEQAWWDSVRSMIGDADTKYSDGLFTPVDVNNLTQAIRSDW